MPIATEMNSIYVLGIAKSARTENSMKCERTTKQHYAVTGVIAAIAIRKYVESSEIFPFTFSYAWQHLFPQFATTIVATVIAVAVANAIRPLSHKFIVVRRTSFARAILSINICHLAWNLYVCLFRFCQMPTRNVMAVDGVVSKSANIRVANSCSLVMYKYNCSHRVCNACATKNREKW